MIDLSKLDLDNFNSPRRKNETTNELERLAAIVNEGDFNNGDLPNLVAPAYSQLESYSVGAYVRYNGCLYRAVNNTIPGTLPIDETYFKKTTVCEELVSLRDRSGGCFSVTVSDVCTEQVEPGSFGGFDILLGDVVSRITGLSIFVNSADPKLISASKNQNGTLSVGFINHTDTAVTNVDIRAVIFIK